MAQAAGSASGASITELVSRLIKHELPRSEGSPITIKIVRRKNGDLLEIADRPINQGHAQAADNFAVVSGAGRFLVQILTEFIVQSQPQGKA